MSDSATLIGGLHPHLQGAASAMLQDLHDKFWTIDIAGDGSPGLLSHYTSADGVRGILETGRLFASHALFLNDTSEGIYGRSLVREVIEELAPGLRSVPLREALTRFAHEWDRHPMLAEEVYVACFCEEHDLVSQWERYAQTGAGYSLAFDASGTRPNERATGIRLRKVLYDHDQQRQHVRDTIIRAQNLVIEFTNFPGLSSDAANLFASDAAVHLLSQLAEYPIFFKHQKWSEEKEWRLVRAWWSNDAPGHLGEVGFRVRQGLIVPYLALDIGFKESGSSAEEGIRRWSLPLREIVVGPALTFDLAQVSVRLLLAKHGLDSDRIKIKPSLTQAAP